MVFRNQRSRLATNSVSRLRLIDGYPEVIGSPGLDTRKGPWERSAERTDPFCSPFGTGRRHLAITPFAGTESSGYPTWLRLTNDGNDGFSNPTDWRGRQPVYRDAR